MTDRADLEPLEAECRSIDDFVSLALEAMAEPCDEAYARSLLGKAELQCQMPLDYIKVADVVPSTLHDADAAKDLYEQAEEQVTTVGELKTVVESVRQHFSDATDWVADLEDKLARREANQAKYASFQDREAICALAFQACLRHE